MEARFLGFFDLALSNPNTRRNYRRVVSDFVAYCDGQSLHSICDVHETHVAGYVNQVVASHAPATAQMHAGAIRRFFQWLVTGKVLNTNPAEAVRAPKHRDRGRKVVLMQMDEAKALVEAIDDTTNIGLRDRAMIAVMIWTFARIGTILEMKVRDAFIREGRQFLRLKDGDERPCDQVLGRYVEAYINGCQLSDTPDAPLFQTIKRGSGQKGGTGQLSGEPLLQSNIYKRIRHYASASGLTDNVGGRAVRATGLVAFLQQGGALETASAMAGHNSTRPTKSYSRPNPSNRA